MAPTSDKAESFVPRSLGTFRISARCAYGVIRKCFGPTVVRSNEKKQTR